MVHYSTIFPFIIIIKLFVFLEMKIMYFSNMAYEYKIKYSIQSSSIHKETI